MKRKQLCQILLNHSQSAWEGKTIRSECHSVVKRAHISDKTVAST